jgi:predicted O-methyltransferase YrrM
MVNNKIKQISTQNDVANEAKRNGTSFDTKYIKQISVQNDVANEAKRNGTSFDTKYIKQISTQNDVAIILDRTRDILVAALKKYKPRRILEIGGGMGYSGSVILSAVTPEKFVSIEKNEGRYLVLREILDRSNCTALWDDAYNALAKLLADNDEFDFVFLDGPKAQYGKYFDLIHRLLPHGGVIFADNVDFHGMVTGKIEPTKGTKTIIDGLRDFRSKLENHKYKIDYLPDGDGIIIANKT